jgi:hypothetical protein
MTVLVAQKANVTLIHNLQKIGYKLIVYRYTLKRNSNTGCEGVFNLRKKKWNFYTFESEANAFFTRLTGN